MSEEISPLSSFQYLAGGDLESVRSALIKSLRMNSIPYGQGHNGSQTYGIDPANVFQLYSPRWLGVGRIELDIVDHSQVLVRFCLPAFPDENEIEYHEQEVRDALPPPAAVIRIMDAEGDRHRALAFLGRYLHQFRIRCLQEIQSLLVNSLGLISVYGLTIERQQYPEPGISPTIPARQTKENGQRDILRDDVPLRDDRQELLRLWQSGHTAKDIALRTSKTEKTILNQISLLRKSLGEQLVPRRK